MSQEARQGNKAERVSISAFIDPQERDQLVALARQRDRSFSSLVRGALRNELEREAASPQ